MFVTSDILNIGVGVTRVKFIITWRIIICAQTDGMSNNIFNANEYASRLYRRMGEAFFPEENFGYGQQAGWEPLPNECHHNVESIRRRYPELTPVHGWKVADYGGVVGFIAHSIIMDTEGRYVDITPPLGNAPPWRYPFLIDGTDDYWEAEAYASSLPIRMLRHLVTDRSLEKIREIERRNDEELRRFLSGRRSSGAPTKGT